MCIKDEPLFNADDIRILVINKMNDILRNIDDNSKGEIKNKLYCLKNLILKY